MRRFVALLATLSLWPVTALADQNGVPTATPYDCNSQALSTLSFICDKFKSMGIGDCKVKVNACLNASQELFSGLNIEFATPTNIKNWSGFGGTGEAYAKGALCLLKELKETPMKAVANASIGVGKVSTETTVGLVSFNPQTLTLDGWHRGRACAPIIGCFDGFTQLFKLQSVQSGTPNDKVGQYQVFSTHALDLTAQGQAQHLDVSVPIEIVTPYGKVEATPHFGYGKGVGWVLAPFANNNVKSKWKDNIAPPLPAAVAIDARPLMLDLYGRIPGLKHSQIMPGPLPGQGTIAAVRYLPSRGWISQAGLGNRTVPDKIATWSPPPGVEFPERPDFALASPITPRSAAERAPNLSMEADVKIDYSPTDLVPEYLRKSGVISIDFHVWVKPAVKAAFASQLDLLNMEAAAWRPHAPGSPLPPYSPDTFHQAREFYARAGSSAAATFDVTAGVDLTIEIKIDLAFTTIRQTLINVHPRYTFVKAEGQGDGLSAQSTRAGTYTAHFLSTGKLFKTYQRLNGAQADGIQHIQACLATPKVVGDKIPDPTIEPGDPKKFGDVVDWPCNICVGANYSEATVKKTSTIEKYPAWVKPIFPAQVNNRPLAVRTRCESVGHVGCLDRCAWNKTTNVLTVLETAQEMFAAGRATAGGGRCTVKLAPPG